MPSVCAAFAAAAGLAGSYRTIKASWGPILQQQQQQLTGMGVAGAAAAVSGPGDGVSRPGRGVLDAAVLQEVVWSAVSFVEDEATRRAGGAAAQVTALWALSQLLVQASIAECCHLQPACYATCLVMFDNSVCQLVHEQIK